MLRPAPKPSPALGAAIPPVRAPVDPIHEVPTQLDLPARNPGLPVAAAQPLPAPTVARPTPKEAPARAPRGLERLVGQTLNGRYLVERKIGEGGFGAVFRGRQIATGREVALKLLHPHNVSDATVVARFRREAEACSKLSSPHTVIIYDFDETEDGVLYLAMELLRGHPLQDLQRQQGPLEPRRVLGILNQVADALGEAHSLGIVHRDMKPENVMVDTRSGEDQVKVLDFGIAKIVEQPGKPTPALTAVGQTLGTLEFMSPEQLRGRPLDGRSDIYALGMMAYEMLTGQLPFKNARGPSDIIQFHMQTPPPPPSSLRAGAGAGTRSDSRSRPKIPREVDEVVLRMVAKERDDRHADAAALRQHIASALGTLDKGSQRKEALRVIALIGGLAVLLTALILLVGR
jgi:eukaryotic-like serine/threonine-protein kinase